jgi:SAM-dependent methyltransferase
MHREATHFIEWVKAILPFAFYYRSVLDVGGGDINGNNKYLFTWDDGNEKYECNDIGDAPNATVVCATKDLPFTPQSFDTIISTECFEHDAEYAESMRKIVDMLKPGGMFVFTCATTGRPEHGTRRTTPGQSWGTISGNAHFSDYYKNLTIDDVKAAIDLDVTFESWRSYKMNCDLYFLGIKKGGGLIHAIPPYFTGHSIGRTRGYPHLTGYENQFCLQNNKFTISEPCLVKYGYGERWYRALLGAGTYVANDELFWIKNGGVDPVNAHDKQCKLVTPGTSICVLALAPEHASDSVGDDFAIDSKKDIRQMDQTHGRWKAGMYGWRKLRRTLPERHAMYFVRATDTLQYSENIVHGDTIWVGIRDAPTRVQNNTLLYKWGQALTMLETDYNYFVFANCGCFVNIRKLEEKIILHNIPSHGVLATPFDFASYIIGYFTLTSADIAFSIYNTLHFDLSHLSEAYHVRDPNVNHSADDVMSHIGFSVASYTSLPGSVRHLNEHVCADWGVRLDNDWNSFGSDVDNRRVHAVLEGLNPSSLVIIRWKPTAIVNSDMYENIDYVISKLQATDSIQN